MVREIYNLTATQSFRELKRSVLEGLDFDFGIFMQFLNPKND